jgi:hypothetical protein
VRAAKEVLGEQTIGGAQAGGCGGGCQRSRISPNSARNVRKQRKYWRFPEILAYKSPKTPFFAQKYLTRYTQKMFFEEYINFKIFHYLRHCGVIPVQSFESHIRPQPPGLGLSITVPL